MRNIYAKITKVDPDERIVEGYASTEAMDSQGEIVTRQAIEGALEGYLKFGNVREMHQASAVGKTKLAQMDDKGLKISVKVVDDSAWTKVKEGVYNGFSIGGEATKKNGNMIEGLNLTEISLVDRPACPEALFTLWKAEGTHPMSKKTKADISAALDKVAQASLAKACGMSNLAELARTVQSLSWVLESTEWDLHYKDTESAVPAMLRQGYKQLADAVQAMAAEEAAEAADDAGGSVDVVVASEGEGEQVELSSKAKMKKSEDEDAEKVDDEESEKSEDETEKEEGEEVEREYTDEDKTHLKAVYRMLKESGVLDEVAAEEAAKQAEAEEEKVDEDNKEEKSEDEDAEKVDDEESEKSEDETETEKEEEEAEKLGKVAKALGLKTDRQILKAAGFSSAAQALGTLAEAAQVIKAQQQAIDQLRSMPALTKGVLRVVGRDGKSEDVTVENLIEKGEKPSDVLAKVLSGEIQTGPVAKYARA